VVEVEVGRPEMTVGFTHLHEVRDLPLDVPQVKSSLYINNRQPYGSLSASSGGLEWAEMT